MNYPILTIQKIFESIKGATVFTRLNIKFTF